MRGAGQWLEAIDAHRAAPVRILFARLGVVAACRPLSPGELAECLEMGGQRGARYALYLSCDSLREAGERQMLAGAALSPLDITQGLAYSDILAAAGIIARLSGAGPAQVRQLETEEDAESAIEAGMAGQEAADVMAADNPFSPGLSAQGSAVAADNPFSPGLSAVGGAVAGSKPFAPGAVAESTVAGSGSLAADWATGSEAETIGPGRETLTADGVWSRFPRLDGTDDEAWPVLEAGADPAGYQVAPAESHRADAARRQGVAGHPRAGVALGNEATGQKAGTVGPGSPAGSPFWSADGPAMLTVGAGRAMVREGADDGQSGLTADAMARILADRLRDAASNT